MTKVSSTNVCGLCSQRCSSFNLNRFAAASRRQRRWTHGNVENTTTQRDSISTLIYSVVRTNHPMYANPSPAGGGRKSGKIEKSRQTHSDERRRGRISLYGTAGVDIHIHTSGRHSRPDMRMRINELCTQTVASTAQTDASGMLRRDA